MQDFDLDSSVNRDWAEFQRRLADYLAAMQDEDLLVLESGFEELDESQGLMPCIQFVVWDGDTVRCEVPSNHYLHPDRALTEAEQTYLTELGWNRPTRGPDDEPDDGSPRSTSTRSCRGRISWPRWPWPRSATSGESRIPRS